MEKTGPTHITHLVRFALRHRLIPPDPDVSISSISQILKNKKRQIQQKACQMQRPEKSYKSWECCLQLFWYAIITSTITSSKGVAQRYAFHQTEATGHDMPTM